MIVNSELLSACIFLKSFKVFVFPIRSLIHLEFAFVFLSGSILISSSFSLYKEPPRCLPPWLLPISIPSIHIGMLPFLGTPSSIYCLYSFCLRPFWLVWGDTLLKFWYSFLSYLAMLTSFHVIFFKTVWVKLTSWNWLLDRLSYYELFLMSCLGHFPRVGVFQLQPGRPSEYEVPISAGFKAVVLENGHKVVAFLHAPPQPPLFR